MWGFAPLEFHRVSYTPAFPAIDFFRSLGTISRTNLDQFWYKEGDRYSTCRLSAFQDQASIQDYWKNFLSGMLFKTSEWAHEAEYRLVIHPMSDVREKSARKLEYRFEDLSAIIFGARTEREDKLWIMRIIDQKCAKAGRSDFEFYEVRYTPGETAFQLCKLDFLKIEHAIGAGS